MSRRQLLSAGGVLAVLALGALCLVWRVEQVITTSARAAKRVSSLVDAREALQLHVLTARAGLELSFDDVNSALRALRDVEIEAEVARTRADDLAQGADELAQAASALRAEESAIEMFKTDLALLRLSSQYFPVAVDALTRRGSASGVADQNRDAAVIAAISALRTDVERYEAAPTRELAKRLEATVTTLSGLRANLVDDAANRADLTVVLGHTRAILERKERVDSFARGFAHSPVRQHLESARVAYERAAHGRLGALAAARLAASLLAVLGLFTCSLAAWRVHRRPEPV